MNIFTIFINILMSLKNFPKIEVDIARAVSSNGVVDGQIGSWKFVYSYT